MRVPLRLFCLAVFSLFFFIPMLYADSGGPDAFGYYWYDSNLPAPQEPYSWIEIAPPEGGAGTELTDLTGMDDASESAPIGFSFDFYGNTYTEAVVSSNGFITFDSAVGSAFSNNCIPDADNPNDAVFTFWDDLDLDDNPSSAVYYETQGSAPGREFIVEWDQVPHIGDSGSCFTFQVILYEGSNEIKVQFNTMSRGDQSYADGSSATLGIENDDGTNGLQYSCNPGSPGPVYDGLAVRYSLTSPIPTPSPAVSATPSPSPSTTPTPSATTTPSVTPTPPPPSPTPTNGGTPTYPPTPSVTPTPTAYPTPEYLVIDLGDYSGNGTSDIAVFRPDSGLWAVSGLGRTYFGEAGDIPVPADYSGTGRADVAIFRPDAGLWAVKDATRFYFGGAGDIAVPGDYDGSGSATAAVFGEASGLWSIRGVTRIYFGRADDLPVPGDYDGDGAKDIAVFRSSTGLWAVRGLTRVYFGAVSDIPVPGVYRWYGFGKTSSPFRSEIAIFRPATGLWAVRGATRAYFGRPGDSPVIGDFAGSALDRTAIFRPASGLWAIRGLTRVYFGTRGDIPVAR
ncbi:MAG: hypothetical protein P9M08_05345 [Candidatus Erginobacter occultus]|nr:hypothetical protein [Candidatus Erginobacter occultus]